MTTEHTTAHPTPRLYVRLAVLLAVMTGMEVGLYYLEDTVGRASARTMLVILALLKFLGVIGWYMHLRYEKGLLSRFFGAGFTMALMLYAAVLGSFALTALFS